MIRNTYTYKRKHRNNTKQQKYFIFLDDNETLFVIISIIKYITAAGTNPISIISLSIIKISKRFSRKHTRYINIDIEKHRITYELAVYSLSLK